MRKTRDDVGDRGRVAGVEELERLVVDVVDDHRRRVQRPAARGRVDEVEELQREQRLPDDEEDRHRQQLRQDHVPQRRPAAGAVDRGGVDELARDVLERGQVDHQREADPAPDPDQDDHEQRLVGIAEEALARQPERVEQRVGDPEALVEDEREQHPLGGDRGDERGQERRPVDADQPDPAVQRHRQEEPEPDRDRHEQARVDDRVLDRRRAARGRRAAPRSWRARPTAPERSGRPS